MTQHGVRVLSERDRELLRLVAEQYLVTLPQLAYLAGRSERTARWLRTRWQRVGLVDAAKLLTAESTVVWLTRRGLATVGLPWKSVRPSYPLVEQAAPVAELRLAARQQYRQTIWIPRRELIHAHHPPPLPDALLETGSLSVAVVVQQRPHNYEALEERVGPLVRANAHTLLVLPTIGRSARRFLDEHHGRVTAVAHAYTPGSVRLPVLPSLPLEERGGPADDWNDPVDWQDELLTEARGDIAAWMHGRSGADGDRW